MQRLYLRPSPFAFHTLHWTGTNQPLPPTSPMYPPFDTTIFEIGPFALRWYGLLMATAVLTGSWIASREIARRGKNPEDFWDMLIWVLIPAFIGARLYYVFIQSPRTSEGIGYYLSNPLKILQIWGGGIHIFGAFIFGGIALWLFTKIRRLPTLMYLDAAAVGLPLAQAIGRWGNFINQELYGPPTQSFDYTMRLGQSMGEASAGMLTPPWRSQRNRMKWIVLVRLGTRQ
ncbi:MAG: prolipoprotein diacylglyceryl transferase [Cyanobacteria bacterium P01_A01_bin.114]